MRSDRRLSNAAGANPLHGFVTPTALILHTLGLAKNKGGPLTLLFYPAIFPCK